MKKQSTTVMVGAVVLVPLVLALAGATLLTIGIVLVTHNNQMVGVCNSALGQIGQGFDASAAQQCGSAAHNTSIGTWLSITGVALLLIGSVKVRASRKIARTRNVTQVRAK